MIGAPTVMLPLEPAPKPIRAECVPGGSSLSNPVRPPSKIQFVVSKSQAPPPSVGSPAPSESQINVAARTLPRRAT